MKILFIGVFTENSSNVWQANGFEKLGCEVIRYDYRKRLGKNVDVKLEIKNTLDLHHPDICLFSKCNGLNYSVLDLCKTESAVVLWYMDAMNNYNEELEEKIKRCNLFFCTAEKPLKKALNFHSNCFRLQGGYNPSIHFPVNCRKIIDVLFIGSMAFAVNIHQSRVFYKKHVDFKVMSNVHGIDHSKAVSSAKINLNFNEGDSTSNRLYKLLASKGFVLSEPWSTLSEDFEAGKDFDTFSSVEELKDKIKFYLDNDSARNEIAEHGYNTVKKYNDINFARKILEKYKELCK